MCSRKCIFELFAYELNLIMNSTGIGKIIQSDLEFWLGKQFKYLEQNNVPYLSKHFQYDWWGT